MNPINAFGEMLEGKNKACKAVGLALCKRLDVPYLEGREEDRLLGHRLMTVPEEEALKGELLPTRQFKFASGEVLCTNEWPERIFEEDAEQLTEEVWTRENRPDVMGQASEMVRKLPDGIVGAYVHLQSMCLVLVCPTGLKVGIYVNSQSVRGWEPLGVLKKAATA
jgi:hypothetical protein